ncbi:MAG: hypothetical protein J6I53_01305 [Treponema sp.]|nr:hypothetical protein [Treponema sp.]
MKTKCFTRLSKGFLFECKSRTSSVKRKKHKERRMKKKKKIVLNIRRAQDEKNEAFSRASDETTSEVTVIIFTIRIKRNLLFNFIGSLGCAK